MTDSSNGADSILQRISDLRSNVARNQEPGIFDNVDLIAVSSLLERCTIKNLPAGEILLSAGEQNRVIYFVLSGDLSVRLESKESEIIAHCSPGQTIGELSVIDGNPASAFVVAETESLLLAMGEEAFWNLVQVSHAFAVNLLLFMASRMREKNSTVFQGQRLRQKFEHEAMFDALTNLYNRRWLDANFPRLIQRHRTDGKPLTVLMLDIDHFKIFNDTYGHATGDDVLSMTALTMREDVRPSNPCVRIGGEEFLIIFSETDLGGAVHAAERLRKAIRATSILLPDGSSQAQVTVSIGVAEAGMEEDGPELIKRADAALYRAKNNGRDRVES
jgi:diguanylate cyclase (GGDEF)-like protein